MKSRDFGINLVTQEHLKGVEQSETKLEIQQQQTKKSTHLGRTEEKILKPVILLGTTSTPLLKVVGIEVSACHSKIPQDVDSQVELVGQVKQASKQIVFHVELETKVTTLNAHI